MPRVIRMVTVVKDGHITGACPTKTLTEVLPLKAAAQAQAAILYYTPKRLKRRAWQHRN